jgi:hypothetical protein
MSWDRRLDYGKPTAARQSIALIETDGARQVLWKRCRTT